MRTLITHDPYFQRNSTIPWHTFVCGQWPCKWIGCPDVGEPPFVTAYRKRFTLEHAATIRAHVSADERYELFLDSQRVGHGSERGDKDHWFYETYDLALEAGPHVLVARVWSLGALAPFAQISVHPGFIFSPEGEFIQLLGTGIAEWEAKRLEGYEFILPSTAAYRATGATLLMDGKRLSWDVERGEGAGWEPVVPLHIGADARTHNAYHHRDLHLLTPATLPTMLEVEHRVGRVRFVAHVPSLETTPIAVRTEDHQTAEAEAWNRWLRGEQALTLPPKTICRAIIDLENYYCAYPKLIVSGGQDSLVRILWAEALFLDPDVANKTSAAKGHRDEIEGKYFFGFGDSFLPDGGAHRKFETLWWQAGRYLEIILQTADAPLTLESFTLRETRYPLELESEFESDDPRLSNINQIAWRALQMCAHETYMDCPYYEQLMYLGDTRTEALVTHIGTRDDQLPRKALWLFDISRDPRGLTQARYPSHITMSIPPFSLWWIGMLHDYALWRDDLPFVKSLMPGVRSILDAYLTFLGDDGLVHGPETGWSFVDWVPAWTEGIPPDGLFDVSSVVNWQLALAWHQAADLEAWVGEPELSARARRFSAELAARLTENFWDTDRNLFADDRAKQHFSEHAQCLAVLSGQLDADHSARLANSLRASSDLTQTTVYFAHYLFEAYYRLNLSEKFFDRLNEWFTMETLGLKTTLETPEPSRSDCHAWSAHPLYHCFASILGIRPGGPGFRTVTISPRLGPLNRVRGKLVHPRGVVEVDIRLERGILQGVISLPDGITGTFQYAGESRPLRSGQQKLKQL